MCIHDVPGNHAPCSKSNIAKRSVRPLQWRHNERDGVLIHQPCDCLLNRLIKVQIKENIKAPRHWPLCGEVTGDGEFPAQRASNTENVSIWWRHHAPESQNTELLV